MGGELARKLGRVLVACREWSGHNRLSVEHFSREESKAKGREFFVHNTSLLKYEKGGWPSPPKLLTLARAYGVPLGRFFKALGAEDSEVCGHVVSAEDKEFFDCMREPALAELHRKLQRLVESSGEEAKTVISVIELADSKVRGAADAGLKRTLRSRERTSKRKSQSAEPVYVDIPLFVDCAPTGPPTEAAADGLRKILASAPLAEEGRYVVRVSGDAMSPEIRDGDLLLVDYYQEAHSRDIVCVRLNGKTLVRRLIRRGKRVTLRSLATKDQEIRVGSKDDFQIQGVALKIVERDLSRGG